MGDDESDGIQEPELPVGADDAGDDDQVDDDTANSYRDTLIKSMQASQDSYDKYVISLSSSALGVSFAFLDKLIDMVHAEHKPLLFLAWGLWAVAISATLISFYVSQRALEDALDQWEETRQVSRSNWDNTTRLLNKISGISFVMGILELILFVCINLS
jgi:hypothetical protein